MDSANHLPIHDRPDGVLVPIRVTPRSSRSQIEGFVEGSLRVRLAAAPVDGAANDALVKLLASHFRIPKASVEIVSGARGRNKQVLLRGIDTATVKARLQVT